eukprot:GEMP01003781.1.p1 GENE.GEMP01003781.1~~GEMP01003781.1.p1  ORF type:complete len:1067 (+),score=262.00 GEMP01003781.1:138-3338(+)
MAEETAEVPDGERTAEAPAVPDAPGEGGADMKEWMDGLGQDASDAATKLQSKRRQTVAKREVSQKRELKQQTDASVRVQCSWRQKQARKEVELRRQGGEGKGATVEEAAEKLQLSPDEKTDLEAWADGLGEDAGAAATKLQSRHRQTQARRTVDTKRQLKQQETDASVKLQSTWRGKQARRTVSQKRVEKTGLTAPSSPGTAVGTSPSHAMPTPTNGLLYVSNDQKENAEDYEYMDEHAVRNCVDEAQLEDIVQECFRNGTLYEDVYFPASEESLYRKPHEPPEYASAGVGVSIWQRADKLREAVIFPDNHPCGDCTVGDLEDLWLVGAASIVSCRPDLIANNFHSTQFFRDAGIVSVRLFREGEWRIVALDTRLPYCEETASPEGKRVTYGHGVEKEEMWFPLLEKAFAKFLGSYEALHAASSVGDALVDLTGGCLETYELPLADQLGWQMIKGWFNRGCIICAIGADPEKARDGIISGHSYGILDVVEVDGMKLLRIRNPWKQEWKGALGDHDQMWQKHDLKEKLKYEFGDDGTFWMRFEDFDVFKTVHVCVLFPPTYHTSTLRSCWHGLSAAGAPLPPADKRLVDGILPDPDPKFFLNTQFRITLSAPSTHVYISLLQSDANKGPLQSIHMLLLKGKSRIWELNEGDIVARADVEVSSSATKVKQREVTLECDLTAAKDGNHFVLICYQDAPKPDPKEKVAFYLRTYTNEIMVIEQIPTLNVCSLENAWRDTSAGGARMRKNISAHITTENANTTGALTTNGAKPHVAMRENPSWCKNPQFIIQSTKANQMKIVLERHMGRKRHGATGTGTTVGFTVTRMQNGAGDSNDAPLRAAHQRKAAAKQAAEMLDGKLPPLKRKLLALPNEWMQETSYAAEDNACMFLNVPKGFGPLIITPSLSEEDVCGNFTLCMYSERSLKHAVVLPQEEHKVVSGHWSQENSGGCHLFCQTFEGKNPTWQRNPIYSIKVRTIATVKITLARPERRWSSMIAKDAVGCMIGFYVIHGDISRDNVMVETTFVPTHEITLEASLSPDEKYSIMPCTYDVGKVGDFVLGVHCSEEFEFA